MYKIFIDDSGSKDYKNSYCPLKKECLPDWKDERKWLDDNFFALCWIHIKSADIQYIDNEIKDLKNKVFGTNHVEIKSTFLRNPKQAKKEYLDKYKITSRDLKYFGDEVYNILEKHKNKFRIFATVFDKRQYKYRDKIDANCLLKSCQVLFERVQYSGLKTIMVFDQMESSLSKKKWNHKKMLEVKQQNCGMEKQYIDVYDNIIDIEFQKSHNENMLQVADLLSYNVRRQFMEHGRCMIDGEGCIKNNNWYTECWEYEYFTKTCNRIYSEKWKTIGIWLVVIPNWKKLNWNLSKCE